MTNVLFLLFWFFKLSQLLFLDLIIVPLRVTCQQWIVANVYLLAEQIQQRLIHVHTQPPRKVSQEKMCRFVHWYTAIHLSASGRHVSGSFHSSLLPYGCQLLHSC